jgi:hypothetical protein
MLAALLFILFLLFPAHAHALTNQSFNTVKVNPSACAASISAGDAFFSRDCSQGFAYYGATANYFGFDGTNWDFSNTGDHVYFPQKVQIDGSQLWLNYTGTAGPLLRFGTTGLASPNSSNATGEKIQMYGGGTGHSIDDYALGMDSSTMWFNVPGGAEYNFWANSRSIFEINGAGWAKFKGDFYVYNPTGGTTADQIVFQNAASSANWWSIQSGAVGSNTQGNFAIQDLGLGGGKYPFVIGPNTSAEFVLQGSSSHAYFDGIFEYTGSTSCNGYGPQLGDLTVERADCSSGVIYFGDAGNNHYLYFDGSNFHFNNGGLYVDGGGISAGGGITENGGSFNTNTAPASYWGVDESSNTVLIANGGNSGLAAGSGLIIVTDETATGDSGVFVVGGGAVVLLGQSSGTTWVVSTAPAGGKFSVGWNGSSYRIYNNQGSNITFGVATIRSRNGN